ncbi:MULTISPECIES: hypothetical protein [Flavobacterium]|uniref:Uncharacterized protein n=1 Tax=Flavobacterium commune TaxID=1306519 RepID=A0A1D9PBS2_9FLAO|nr:MULTISPECIES: hypothetical protein [Flavobacterium]APA00027.1 hypothetical protein BIW12_11615 [Flavobacterium commune]
MVQKHQEDLLHIRSMMERSSRFISLSGLSGVFAGISALIGGGFAFKLLEANGIDYLDGKNQEYSPELIQQLITIASLILLLALFFGILFTVRKSRKNNLAIWTATTKKMLLGLLIPLLAGGLFCIALIYHGMFVLVAPSTLIFYGLALINAAHYTFSDIKYLGISEVILGIIALFFLGSGFVFWMIGFGVLHIFYGLLLLKKYK